MKIIFQLAEKECETLHHKQQQTNKRKSDAAGSSEEFKKALNFVKVETTHLCDRPFEDSVIRLDLPFSDRASSSIVPHCTSLVLTSTKDKHSLLRKHRPAWLACLCDRTPVS